jgi:nifR3 family TIM-barrel protein
MPAEDPLIHPVQLGPLTLRNNLILAEMHKRTHLAFRLLARRFGAALAHTEMATPEDLLGTYVRHKGGDLLASTPQDRPLSVQILPESPGPLAEAVALVLERGVADAIDLNFACPSKRVAGSGRGASFLQEPEKAVPLVETAVRTSRLPVTVKLRHGWTDSADHRERAMELARGAVAAGAAGITLHARSAKQAYHGKADWRVIREWAELLPVPVFGSGDLRSPEAVLAMLRETRCAGASLARGAVGAPWIFRQVIELAQTGTYVPVTLEERARAFMQHYEGLVAQHGPAVGLRMICQIGRMYTRGLRGAAEARVAIQEARSREDLERVVDRWFKPEG